jgi:hypothetical protein
MPIMITKAFTPETGVKAFAIMAATAAAGRLRHEHPLGRQ